MTTGYDFAALTASLAAMSGRCPHGWHLETQGCTDCGLAAKATGQARAAAAHPDEQARVEAAVRQLAACGRPFSANDARAIHGVKGGVVGAVFGALHKDHVIKPCGDETSNARSTNGHRIFLWIGDQS
jgi:hypothetical protein